MGGEGGCQMSILLHKPYLVKWFSMGEGVKNCPYGRPLKQTKIIDIESAVKRYLKSDIIFSSIASYDTFPLTDNIRTNK